MFPVCPTLQGSPRCPQAWPITNLTKASELVPPWPSPAPAGSNRETAAPRNTGCPPRTSAATCQAPLPALCPRPVAWTTRHPGPGQMWALGPRGSFLQTQGKGGGLLGVSAASGTSPPSASYGVSSPRDANSPLSSLQRKPDEGREILGPGTPAHICTGRDTLVSLGTIQLQRCPSCRGGYTGYPLHVRHGAGDLWMGVQKQAQPGTGQSRAGARRPPSGQPGGASTKLPAPLSRLRRLGTELRALSGPELGLPQGSMGHLDRGALPPGSAGQDRSSDASSHLAVQGWGLSNSGVTSWLPSCRPGRLAALSLS